MATTHQPQTALIAGATGLVGGHCLSELLVSDAYAEVIVVARRALEVEHPKLRVVRSDLGALDHAGQELRANDVFCCLGTTMARAGSREAFRKVDYEATVRLARVARQQGATQFLVVSSAGADSESISFYARVKGETEQALTREAYPTLVILRPSLLLGERRERRPAERIAQRISRRVSPAMVGPLRRYRPIEAAHVGRALVRLATAGLTGTHVIESERIAAVAQRE